MLESEIIQAEQSGENISEATIPQQENLLPVLKQIFFEIWKASMAKFYTYDVFGPAINNKYEFHCNISSWVALKEQ